MSVNSKEAIAETQTNSQKSFEPRGSLPSVHARQLSFLLSLLALIGAFIAPQVAAQTYLQDLSVPPFGGTVPVEKGSVNLANGSLNLQIPLGTYPQRGGGTGNLVLNYTSNLGYHTYTNEGIYYHWTLGYVPLNWGISTPADTSYKLGLPFLYGVDYTGYCDYGYGEPLWVNYSGFAYTAPDGSTHTWSGINTYYAYDPANCPAGYLSTGSGYDDQGTGYYISITNYTDAVVTGPDGTVYNLITNTKTDPNGNESSMSPIFGSSAGSYAYDTLNRSLIQLTTSGTTDYYAVPNAQGGTSTYTIKWQTVNINTNFGITLDYEPVTEYSGSFQQISEIDLPDGTAYYFNYDSGTAAGHYGELTSITLPTGGTISYSYSNATDATGLTYRWLTHRTTPDSGTGWSYGTPSGSLGDCGSGCTTETFTVTAPSGDYSVHTFANLWSGMLPTETQYYNASSNLLASKWACYASPTYYGYGGYNANASCPAISAPDPYLLYKTAEITTLAVPSGNVTSMQEYTYDCGTYTISACTHYSNLTNLQEWNFGSSLSGSPDRTTTYTYYNNGYVVNRPATITITNSGGGLVAKTVNTYDGSTPTGASATQHDSSYGTSFNARGNLTQVQKYTSSSSYVTSTMAYDTTGQLITSTDANGSQTHYGYADNFFNDSGNNSSPSTYTPSAATNAYLTSETVGYGTSVAETSTFGYYFGTGQMAKTTDPNSQTTVYNFYDSLSRPTSSIFPDSGWNLTTYSGETQVDTYTGITSSSLTTSCPTSGNACRHDQTLLDSLDRVVDQNLVSDPDGQDTTATVYDANGRVQKTSNPYRSTSDSTYGWTTPTYDGLDRVTQTQDQDGSVSYSYYGSQVGTGGGATSQLCSGYGTGFPILKVDEAGKKLQSWIDGFGRLIEADEPNSSGTVSVNTCYSYDLNNNLTGVLAAGGTQTRSFSYDLLSRLTSAANPESGTTTYSYDGNGNVTTKTDSRSITTTYGYDPLNRLTSKTYSNSTPGAYYYYDQTSWFGWSLSNPIGKLTSEGTNDGTNWLATEGISYDSIGRPSLNIQCRVANTVCKTIYHTYNYDGSVASIAYPSGRTITYTPNSTEQTVSTVDTANSINYATSAAYTPVGSLGSLMNGSTLLSSRYYNSRLRPCRIAVNSSGTAPNSCTSTNNGNVLDLSYNFSAASSDNGNVTGITNNVDTSRSQSYTYDTLNRLATAATTSTYSTSPSRCWGESYTIDALANLTAITQTGGSYVGCTGESLSVSVGTNNRLSTSGFTYDWAGNMTHDASHSYFYDAENHLVQIDGTSGTCSTATECYVYDSDGQRVEKATSSASKLYWYDTSGNVLDETDGSGNITNSAFNEYVYFNGKRIAWRAGAGGTSLTPQNPSFETYNTLSYSGPYGYYNLGPIPNWTTSGAAGSFDPTSYSFSTVPDGSITVYANYGATISQTLTGVSLQPNSTYTLTAYVGDRADCCNGDYSIELLAGSTVLASTSGSSTTFPLGTFAMQTVTYTTGSTVTSGDIGIVLANTSGTESTFDDVHLSVAGANAITYYFGDQLGTTRAMATSAGTLCYDADYYPFGGERAYTTTCSQNYKFTGKERDSESNLDNFGARYYGSSLGRFMSPDPLGNFVADPTNPQSWNMYSYVLNNPLSLVDPTGYDCVYFNDAGTGLDDRGDPIDTNSNSDECGRNGGDWVNGTVDPNKFQYHPENDTFTIGSSSAFYNYSTTVSAPGSQTMENNGDMSCFGNCATAYSQNFSMNLFSGQPLMVSWILPVWPVPVLGGIGPAGSVAWNPKTKNLCVSAGVGASGGHNVAGGTITGRTLSGQAASPAEIDKILSGGSISFGGNYGGPFPVGPGAQFSGNQSGAVYGPTGGVEGFSASATNAACVQF